MCMCLCLCVYTMCVQVPTETRKGCWVPRSWNYRKLWTVLGGLSARATNALNFWAISPLLPPALKKKRKRGGGGRERGGKGRRKEKTRRRRKKRRGLLCSPGWPQTHSVVDLASWMLGLQVCTTMFRQDVCTLVDPGHSVGHLWGRSRGKERNRAHRDHRKNAVVTERGD